MDVFYDTNGKMREYEGIRTGKRGKCSEIYHDGSLYYKKYFYTTSHYDRITYDIWECIQAIGNSHLMRIGELLYSRNNVYNLSFLRDNIRDYEVDAYQMGWIREDDTNILEIAKEYILENLYEIFRLGEIFASYGVYMNDVKRENIVINRKGIVLIDPDIYSYKAREDLGLKVKEYNDFVIKRMFIEMVLKENKINITTDQAIDLFEGVNNKDEMTDISKKLRGYKSLNEYFASLR